MPKTITTMPKLDQCSNLKVLSMPGVVHVYQNDGFINWALGCKNLTTLIVSELFWSDGQVFYSWSDSVKEYMTVYTTASADANIKFTGTNNNMWNGTVVYYSEDTTAEGTWQWAADGKGIVLNGAQA